VPVQCPQCQSMAVVKCGQQPNGTQRYRGQNPDCARRTFLLTYQDKGRLPAVKRQMVDLTLNGSGVRIVRVLGVSSATVITTLKKRRPPSSP
jgi:transposase-like protein